MRGLTAANRSADELAFRGGATAREKASAR
jgi:hypothetical protein